MAAVRYLTSGVAMKDKNVIDPYKAKAIAWLDGEIVKNSDLVQCLSTGPGDQSNHFYLLCF